MGFSLNDIMHLHVALLPILVEDKNEIVWARARVVKSIYIQYTGDPRRGKGDT